MSGATLARSCVFCEKGKDDVRMLFAAPNAAICDACIESFAEILFGQSTATEPPGEFHAFGEVPAGLVGEWRRRRDTGETPAVQIRFYPGGLMVSQVAEPGGAKSMLLRYRVEDGGGLVTAELVATRARKSQSFRLEGDTLTLDGGAVFERVT